MIRVLILACGLSLISLSSAWAACTGSSPNWNAQAWSDVGTCISNASNGDTITIAPGTFAGTSGTGIGTDGTGKYVTLQGSGTVPAQGAATSGGTIIEVNSGPPYCCMVGIIESTTGNIRIRNITFRTDSTKLMGQYGILLVGNRVAGGKQVVFENLTFDLKDKWEFPGGQHATVILDASARSIISNSIFTGQAPPGPAYYTNRAAMRCPQNTPLAAANWQAPPTYGAGDTNGASNLYFEGNRVEFYNDALDHDDGCRLVVRYNTFTNSSPKGHGADSGYGARHFEYYNNRFICAPGVLGSFSYWIFQRGGTGVVTENTFDHMDKTTCGYVPGGGVAMGAGIYRLTKALVGCWPPPFGYPVTRQIGWGWSGGGTTTQDGFRQDLEPTYFWNNTNNTDGDIVPGDSGVDTCGNQLHTADYYKQNREWYLSAKPGYVKYQYPHPLVQSAPLAAPSGPAPSSSGPPPSPSNLQVK